MARAPKRCARVLDGAHAHTPSAPSGERLTDSWRASSRLDASANKAGPAPDRKKLFWRDAFRGAPRLVQTGKHLACGALERVGKFALAERLPIAKSVRGAQRRVARRRNRAGSSAAYSRRVLSARSWVGTQQHQPLADAAAAALRARRRGPRMSAAPPRTKKGTSEPSSAARSASAAVGRDAHPTACSTRPAWRPRRSSRRPGPRPAGCA